MNASECEAECTHDTHATWIHQKTKHAEYTANKKPVEMDMDVEIGK
jgi:hypothetical protein